MKILWLLLLVTITQGCATGLGYFAGDLIQKDKYEPVNMLYLDQSLKNGTRVRVVMYNGQQFEGQYHQNIQSEAGVNEELRLYHKDKAKTVVTIPMKDIESISVKNNSLRKTLVLIGAAVDVGLLVYLLSGAWIII